MFIFAGNIIDADIINDCTFVTQVCDNNESSIINVLEYWDEAPFFWIFTQYNVLKLSCFW